MRPRPRGVGRSSHCDFSSSVASSLWLWMNFTRPVSAYLLYMMLFTCPIRCETELVQGGRIHTLNYLAMPEIKLHRITHHTILFISCSQNQVPVQRGARLTISPQSNWWLSIPRHFFSVRKPCCPANSSSQFCSEKAYNFCAFSVHSLGYRSVVSSFSWVCRSANHREVRAGLVE